MPDDILLSSAYFPPAEYFSLIKNADRIFIEREENYIRQTYRNRCKILTSTGILVLSVPVMKGMFLKTPVRDVAVDYSKRWQQVHLRAMIASYSTSPYFQFYYENIEKAIMRNHKYLLDLNDELLRICVDMLKIKKRISYTTFFEPVAGKENDFRYLLTPKNASVYNPLPYCQVFDVNGFVPGLSILDMIFNMGPGSAELL